jgi:hypothetical protein
MEPSPSKAGTTWRKHSLTHFQEVINDPENTITGKMPEEKMVDYRAKKDYRRIYPESFLCFS